MDRERVDQIIKRAGGNLEFGIVLRAVAEAGGDLLDQFSDGVVERKLIHAVGVLTHRRIEAGRLLSLGEKYWQTKEGVVTQRRISGFLETRLK
jgi:hypothetical protein